MNAKMEIALLVACVWFVVSAFPVLAVDGLPKGKPALSNRYLSIVFDPQTGRLASIRNNATSNEYLFSRQLALLVLYVDPKASSRWHAVPRQPLVLESLDGWRVERTERGQQLVLQYVNEEYQITATVRVTLGEDEFVRWQLQIENKGPATVVKVDFPRLVCRRSAFVNDRLVWPYRRGQIIPYPIGRREIVYPGPASMQWLWYGDIKEGLYLAVYDRGAEYKVLQYSGTRRAVRLSFSLWPFAEPETNWSAPPAEMGIKNGEDWYWAAERYRDWLVNEVKWTRDSAPWAKEMTGFGVAFIADGQGNVVTPFRELARVAEQTAERGSDILEIKGWHVGGFDTLYPEYRPNEKAGGAQALESAAQAITTSGCKLLFYMNSRIANKETEWYSEQARANDVVGSSGNTYTEKWNDYDFSVMCPAAPGWQRKLFQHQQYLVDIGGRGMFFDQMGAMHPILCYNPGHGHLSPASAFSEGHRRMLSRFHDLWGKNDTHVFIAEGVVDYLGEYLDLHGLVWAFKYHGEPFDAPEVTRYTLPGRIAGISEANRTDDQYYQAYLLGCPFVGVPRATVRFQRIYRREPDVFFYGRFLDKRGVSVTNNNFRVALHVNESGSKLVLIAWNDSGDDVTETLSVNLGGFPLMLGSLADLEVIDVETGKRPSFQVNGKQLDLELEFRSGEIRTIKIGNQVQNP